MSTIATAVLKAVILPSPVTDLIPTVLGNVVLFAEFIIHIAIIAKAEFAFNELNDFLFFCFVIVFHDDFLRNLKNTFIFIIGVFNTVEIQLRYHRIENFSTQRLKPSGISEYFDKCRTDCVICFDK